MPMDEKLRRTLRCRFRSVEGHIRGIVRMVEEDRPCAAVLQQIQAVQGSLTQIQLLLLRAHLDRCLDRWTQEDPERAQALREELVSFLRAVGCRCEDPVQENP